MNHFFIDTERDELITWSLLIDDIKNSSTYNPYCKSGSYYEVFKQIITSLIIGEEIILLDSDFTDLELEKLTGYSNYDAFTKIIDKDVITIPRNREELLKLLQNKNDDWKITLFTSGTTGIPKKVTHDFNSITRFAKISKHNSTCVWGYAYNPTHMAGIQVFFQALLNGNSIVRIFGLSPDKIYLAIKENEITHISATPTFYRLLLPCTEIFQSVKRLSSGGEKFHEKTISSLKACFPNAKITNIYASTEAGTLLASEDDVFSIKPESKHLIRIENDELLIHSSLMGRSEMSFDEWYRTGDLIEIITKKPFKFRFISRKSDMINVGGYKVNPLEVEEFILNLSGVKNARVYSKANSVLGSIICCDIVRNNEELSESSIRKILQSKIQEFKIPRIIRFVDELSTTRTGKIKRN